jgi:amino acid adenylation domain-containing protein
VALPGERELGSLSEREEALWLFQRAYPRHGVASVGFSFRVPGDLELPVLRAAAGWVLRHHPVLGSTVRVHDGRPVRVLLDPAAVPVTIDRRDSTSARLDDDIRAAAGRPFDPGRDELVRFTLFDLADGTMELLVTVHHVVFDAMSAPLIARSLQTAYDSIASTGRPPAEPPQELPGPTDPSEESLAYWKARIDGLRPDAMILDAAGYSDPGASFAGGRYRAPMTAAGSAAVRQLRRVTQTTDNAVLLAAYLLLLHRHGAADDLVAGVPVDLRLPGQQDLVGHNFAIVPVRVRLTADDSFCSFTRRTLEAFFEAFEHRDVSYETMARRFLRHDYDWQAPLFRHLFNFWPMTSVPGERGDWGEMRQVDTGYTRFDLELSIDAREADYVIQLAYRRDLHEPGFVRRFCDRYEALLQGAAADPDGRARALPITTRHDAAIRQANRTSLRWPPPGTTAGMIGAHVRDHPDRVALTTAGGDVTYGELGRLADRIAARLGQGGVRRGDVVAVAAGRGPVSAAATLAVWRLGAAYLPLDPAQPAERLRRHVRAAATAAIVASAPAAAALAGTAPFVLQDGDLQDGDLQPDDPGAGAGPDGGSATEPQAGDIAYVIYTSGSTGQPKGVRITHASLANVVRHFARVLDFGPELAMSWLTTFAFDISALELFLPLSCGGRVVVVDDQVAVHAQRLMDLIAGQRVDVVQATPTLWRLAAALPDFDLTGRWVLCGGEPLTAALARRLHAAGARLLNVYGPTETTIWSTAALVDGSGPGRPPVGRPIANTTVAVLDAEGNECPVDVQGEVVIAGAGVGAGYLGSDPASSSRFIEAGRDSRAYRTGDLGLWLADGQLELRGRRDRQVKIRGQRLELGEVEAVLDEHPAVTMAAAVLTGQAGQDQQLAAFVTANQEVTSDELWDSAARRLPGYAVPGRIRVLGRLPLSPSGKIDYARLAELAREQEPAGERTVPGRSPGPPAAPAPSDDVGAWLVTVWRDLLDDPALHAESNFFLSGGQSIMAISITERIKERYDIEVSLITVLNNPTPRRLRMALDPQLSPGPATAS